MDHIKSLLNLIPDLAACSNSATALALDALSLSQRAWEERQLLQRFLLDAIRPSFVREIAAVNHKSVSGFYLYPAINVGVPETVQCQLIGAGAVLSAEELEELGRKKLRVESESIMDTGATDETRTFTSYVLCLDLDAVKEANG